MTRDELRAHIDAFVATLSAHNVSWYTSPRDVASDVLRDFDTFVYAEEDAKEERRKLFLELQKEFGKEQQQ